MPHVPPRLRHRAALLATVVSLAALPARAPGQGVPGDPGCRQPENLLPPRNPLCFYFTERGFGPTFITPLGVVRIVNVRHGIFRNIVVLPIGPDEQETFQSTINATLQVEGRADQDVTFDSVAVQTRVFGRGANPLGTFQTEMLQLDAGFGAFRLRESPTLRSLGQTTVSSVGGNFRVDSFFDILTELSVDEGRTWIPSQGGMANPERVSLSMIPEPSAAALTVVGLATLAGAVRLRRRATTRTA